MSDDARRAALLEQIGALSETDDEESDEDGSSGSDDDAGDAGGEAEVPPELAGILPPPLDEHGLVAGAPHLKRTLRTYRNALALDDETAASLRRDCSVTYALDGSNWQGTRARAGRPTTGLPAVRRPSARRERFRRRPAASVPDGVDRACHLRPAHGQRPRERHQRR